MNDTVLPFATVDVQRPARTGFPEAIYGAGKTAEQIVGIAQALLDRGQVALATRVDAAKAAVIVAALGGRYAPVAQVWWSGEPAARAGRVALVCAGTSDLPVADEAAECLAAFGVEVLRVVDVGVAGVHRLLARVDDLQACDVVIVVAGMDGALPGVVAGVVAAPVVAVPTSVGYGASFGGIAPLLTMLNACSPGIGVVNIDNGFGAASLAARMLAVRVRP